MVKRLRLLPTLAAVVVGASSSCSSTEPSDNFASGRARVMGIVTRPDGTPLDKALVTVHLPESIRRQGFAYGSATTGPDGRFQAADIIRVVVDPQLGSLDTLTAYAVANASGPMYKPGPGGGYPTDSAAVLIRFYPEGQTPIPASVTVRVAVR